MKIKMMFSEQLTTKQYLPDAIYTESSTLGPERQAQSIIDLVPTMLWALSERADNAMHTHTGSCTRQARQSR